MQIYLLLNTSCNLSCEFCIRGKHHDDNLDPEAWRKALFINSFKGAHLILTGGEPSLYKNINSIIRMSMDHFCSLSVNTNGVESAWIDQAYDRNFHVQISLDGTARIHNTMRTDGNIDVFSCVLATIKKLEKYGISYNISTTVGKRNYDDIIELMKFLPRLRTMKYWKVSPQLPFGCGKIDSCISIEKWNALVDHLIQKATVPLHIKRYFDFKLLDQFIAQNPGKLPGEKINCGDVRHKLYIYPNLTVYPCTCLTDFPLGNLQKHTLLEIIESPQSQVFTEYTVEPQSYCHLCKYLPFCNGGCIGMSYHFWGKLGKGDYRCPLLHITHTIP